MQLSEIKTRGWWIIEDDATTPSEITDTEMGVLINEAVQDMALSLNLQAKATITLTANVGAMPTDFMSLIRVEDADGNYIQQISDINSKDSFSQCFHISDHTVITVYPTATAEANVVMHYYKYPAALTEATDVPSEIPLAYHHYIADIFVKAHYALKRNFLDEYNGLMLIWDDVKRQVAYACKNRRGALVSNEIVDIYGGFRS